MRITMPIDSATPISQPRKTMMLMTEVIMKKTDMTEVSAWIIFRELMSKITKLKETAIAIPLIAPLRKAFSDSAIAKKKPPLNLRLVTLE